MDIKKNIESKITKLSHLLIKNNLKLATAESCTGGLISAFCTDLSGSSKWFYATVVSYNNQAKIDLLQVENKIIKNFGAVSEQTVRQMCLGLLNKMPVDVVVAVSGVAGPTGGTKINPVGSVYIGVQKRNKRAIIEKYNFAGDRKNIRYNAVQQALQNIIKLLEG